MTAKKSAKPGTKLIPGRDEQPETDILADLIYRVVMRLLNGREQPAAGGRQSNQGGGLLSTILSILLGGRL